MLGRETELRDIPRNLFTGNMALQRGRGPLRKSSSLCPVTLTNRPIPLLGFLRFGFDRGARQVDLLDVFRTSKTNPTLRLG